MVLQEWDGLVRLAFQRKNKTLAANFKSDAVLTMLEQNYKTFCALNNVMADDSVAFKDQVLAILDATGMSEKRAAKMDIDDFLALLAAFNEKGIHFS